VLLEERSKQPNCKGWEYTASKHRLLFPPGAFCAAEECGVWGL